MSTNNLLDWANGITKRADATSKALTEGIAKLKALGKNPVELDLALSYHNGRRIDRILDKIDWRPSSSRKYILEPENEIGQRALRRLTKTHPFRWDAVTDARHFIYPNGRGGSHFDYSGLGGNELAGHLLEVTGRRKGDAFIKNYIADALRSVPK